MIIAMVSIKISIDEQCCCRSGIVLLARILLVAAEWTVAVRCRRCDIE
jgi:hypothetical protein